MLADAAACFSADTKVEQFVDFATTQFERRYARIERARGQSLADVLRQGGESL